jgi:multidrug efflux system outer membrane protein
VRALRAFPRTGDLLLALLGALTVASLSACSVGPDYVRPELDTTAAWDQAADASLAATEAEPDRWWQHFDDALLNSLVERAHTGNLSLEEAAARVVEAWERRGISVARFFPTVRPRASYTRQFRSANATDSFANNAPRHIDNFLAGFDTSWEIDIFGGLRRGLEASDADMAAIEADLRDIEVMMSAEVARNYIEVRSAQLRRRLATDNLALQRETLERVEARFAAGLATDLDVAQAETIAESTAASIPAFTELEEAAANRIAVLLGLAPGELRAELAEPAPIPRVPASIAVGIPADTLRRRPDVRRAERELAAETARIGVVEAEVYPKLQFGGTIGLSAANAVDVFTSGSTVRSLGPTLTWRLFESGTILHAIAAQDAVALQALAAWERTSLEALEEADNAMNAFVQDQDKLASLERAEAAAARAVDVSRTLYDEGLARFDRVLDSQRQLVLAQDAVARVRAEVAGDAVALYKALGGGW